MILELFIVLFVLAAFLIALGYYTQDSFYAYVGLFFLFIIGVLIMTNQLQYKIGETFTPCDWEEYYVYGDNYSGYHWDYITAPPVCNNPTDTSCINLFHAVRNYSGCVEIYTDVYDNFSGSWARWIGMLLAFAAGAGMALQFYYWRITRE